MVNYKLTSSKVSIPVYIGTLYIHSGSIEELEENYPLDNLKNYNAYSFSGQSKEDGPIEYHIAFRSNASPGTVTHECFHFVCNMFNDRGVKFDYDNNEPFAYMMGWAVETCTKTLKKLNNDRT